MAAVNGWLTGGLPGGLPGGIRPMTPAYVAGRTEAGRRFAENDFQQLPRRHVGLRFGLPPAAAVSARRLPDFQALRCGGALADVIS